MTKASASSAASRRINSYERRVAPKRKGCDIGKKKNHPVRTYARFLQMTVDERSAYIKRKQLCLSCWLRKHSCCFTWRGRYHTLHRRGNSSQRLQIQSAGFNHEIGPEIPPHAFAYQDDIIVIGHTRRTQGNPEISVPASKGTKLFSAERFLHQAGGSGPATEAGLQRVVQGLHDRHADVGEAT